MKPEVNEAGGHFSLASDSVGLHQLTVESACFPGTITPAVAGREATVLSEHILTSRPTIHQVAPRALKLDS